MAHLALPLIDSTTSFHEIVSTLTTNSYSISCLVINTFSNLMSIPQVYGSIANAINDEFPIHQLQDNTVVCEGLMGLFAIIRVLSIQDLENFNSKSNFRKDPIREILNSVIDLPEEQQGNLMVLMPVIANVFSNLFYLERLTPRYFARNVDGERQGIGSPTGKFTIGTANINAAGKSCGSFYYTRYVHRPTFGDFTKKRSNHALIRSPIGVKYSTPTHALMGAWLSSIRYSGYLPASIARYNIITMLTYMREKGIPISLYRKFVYPNGVHYSIGEALSPFRGIAPSIDQQSTGQRVYTLGDIQNIINDKARRIPIQTLEFNQVNTITWTPMRITSPFSDTVVSTFKLTRFRAREEGNEDAQLSDPETLGTQGGDHPVVCVPGGDEDVRIKLVDTLTRIPKLIEYLVSGFFLIGMNDGHRGMDNGLIRVYTYYGKGVSLQILQFSRADIVGIPEGILVVEYLPHMDPIYHTL